MQTIQFNTTSLIVHDHPVEIAVQRRIGAKPPLIALHGFGSTKEDYADLILHPEFKDRDLIAFDAPGFGQSRLQNFDVLSIPFLVETARSLADALGADKFHLCGHSMGGLAALLLADQYPDRVLSFFNIEGNIAPEDCFLSRQILHQKSQDNLEFLSNFADYARRLPENGLALFAAGLAGKVQAGSIRPVFESLVELSDNAGLMAKFAGLSCPRAFVHGDQNNHLSYLPKLSGMGVKQFEIAQSGHFPMYSNPPALWQALSGFLQDSEA